MNYKEYKERYHRGEPKTWWAWYDMINRCTNERIPNYHRYGGRGITVCTEWLNSYDNFLCDMGPATTGVILDRIDNDKGYYKENCRWTDSSTSMHNTRTRVDNKTGIKGVCQTGEGRWMAYGSKNGDRSIVYSGFSKEAAIAARREWELRVLKCK